MSKYKSMNTHIREAQGCNFMYCTYCDDFAIYRSHVKMITQRRLIYCQRLDNEALLGFQWRNILVLVPTL